MERSRDLSSKINPKQICNNKLLGAYVVQGICLYILKFTIILQKLSIVKWQSNHVNASSVFY